MRATRGLWAAVGAGTSLAAAGLLALFSVSVILAVRGWPQVSRADGDSSVALRAKVATPGTSGSAAAAAPSPVVLPHRGTAAKASQRRNAGRRRGSAHHGSGMRRPATRRPGGSGSTPAGSTAVPSPSGSGTASGNPIAQVPHTVSTTITNVTDAAGATLRPVSPPVAQIVTATGQQAGGAIDEVGPAVDGIVGGLTGGN